MDLSRSAQIVTLRRDAEIIPIASRFVTTDQWLVTHINISWKVSEVKLYLLSKFFPASFASVPSVPRIHPVSKRKTVSPIRFASRSLASPATAAQTSDAEHGYDEDESDFGDEVFSQYKFPVNRRSMSTLPLIAKPVQGSDQASGNVKLSGKTDPASYTLLTFSSGQILEDHYKFEWCNIYPHELLEIHPASSFISLPKLVPSDYAQPYFEARVWALRAISKPIDDLEGGSRATEPLEYPSDTRGGDPNTIRRDRLAKKKRTKLEWRVRWVVVHQGRFMLYKTRNDNKPTHNSPLSSLIDLRDHHLSEDYPSPLLSPTFDQPSSSQKKEPKHYKSNIISAKFRAGRTKSSRLGQNVVDFTGSMSSAASGWWRRGSKDAGAGPDKPRRESAPDSDTPSDGQDDQPYKQGGVDGGATDNCVWIVLDMLDSDAYQNLLRLLHRHAAPTVPSSFFPASSITRVEGKDTQLPKGISQSRRDSERSPSPISFASNPSSTLLGSRSPSPISNLPSPGPSASRSQNPLPVGELVDDTDSVQYPSWRFDVLRRARRAGWGTVGEAISQHVFGDPETDDQISSKKEKRGRKRAKSKGQAAKQERHNVAPDEGAATGIADESEPGSDTELLYHMGSFVDHDTESGSSVEEDGTRSELEWEGWAQDVQRQRDIAALKMRDKRQKNTFQWDADWTWGSQARDLGVQDEVPPLADPPLSMSAPGSSRRNVSGRSLTSYASTDSLFRRPLKRDNSKREPPTVVSTIVRTDPSLECFQAQSPAPTEFDYLDEEEEGHEPKYTYFRSSYAQGKQSARGDEGRPEMEDHAIPFHSYTDPSLRLPVSMSVTVTSTVSVGGRDDLPAGRRAREGGSGKSRGNRRSVLM